MLSKLLVAEVIASGYEWICPSCETLNREISWQEDLECGECKVKAKAILRPYQGRTY